jgi:hypothetical protein
MPSPDEIDAQTYMYAVAGGYAASQYGTEIEEMQDALSELQRVGAHRKLVAHLELRIARATRIKRLLDPDSSADV